VAGMLHASWPAVETHPSQRTLAVCRVTGPAVVLGSTQAESLVDLRRAGARGIEVVRRRSGGGARDDWRTYLGGAIDHFEPLTA